MRSDRRPQRSAAWIPLALPLLAGLFACTFTHDYEVDGRLENPPPVQGLPVPVAVGVYYGPELRGYEHTNSKPHHLHVVPLGEPSVRLFDQVFAVMFERVERVSSRPPLEEAPRGIGAVMEARIEEFQTDFPAMVLFSMTVHAEVAYRFTLYSLDGTPTASWIVEGEAQRQFGIGDSASNFLGDVTDLALRDAARKLMTGFQEVPEVRRWLRQVTSAETR